MTRFSTTLTRGGSTKPCGFLSSVRPVCLGISCCSAFGMGSRRPGRSEATRKVMLAFLLLPMAMFFGALLVARINIGVCLALHLYPLLHILAGRAAVIGLGPKRSGRVALGLLVAWSAVSAARIAPFPVAYFNELVGGPRGGRHILTDSNLDWGQGLRALAHYLFP